MAASFASFVAGGSAEAVRHVRELAAGDRAGCAWLHGPAGTGKTHLLQAACATAAESGRAGYLPLSDFAQGEAGVLPADPEYLAGIRRLCDERNLLMILDEVQTGLGRTGEWFGFQHADVAPDVVTMAKALGNGVPISACWAKAEVAAAFQPGDHATTFGGNPLCTAAARATLEVMEDEDVPGKARHAGALLRGALEELRGVSSVRGAGLLLAVELDGLDAPKVAGDLLSAGVIVNAVTPTALRLAPSLLISDDEVAEATRRIGVTLAANRAEVD